MYQGLSPHIPLLFPLQEGPSIVLFLVPPFCLGQNLWSQRWDMAAGQQSPLLGRNEALAPFLGPLAFLVLQLWSPAGCLEPRGHLPAS